MSKFKLKPRQLPPTVQAGIAHLTEKERLAFENVVGVHTASGIKPEDYKHLSLAQIQEYNLLRKFITSDPDMAQMLLRANIYAKGHEPVLITGESGTGKELVARIVGGPETDERPFVALNCAGFTDELLGNELFGHVPGAYTGATSRGKIGMLAAARQGTLFLDEIGDMPVTQQAVLLRVLQDRRYYPVGSTDQQKAECRFVFATNVDLHTAVREGRFRRDLFWRISALQLHITPIRDRPADAMLICKHFAEIYNDPLAKDYVHPFTDEELERIPCSQGNVREIENYIIARRYEYRLTAGRQS